MAGGFHWLWWLFLTACLTVFFFYSFYSFFFLYCFFHICISFCIIKILPPPVHCEKGWLLLPASLQSCRQHWKRSSTVIKETTKIFQIDIKDIKKILKKYQGYIRKISIYENVRHHKYYLTCVYHSMILQKMPNLQVYSYL